MENLDMSVLNWENDKTKSQKEVSRISCLYKANTEYIE